MPPASLPPVTFHNLTSGVLSFTFAGGSCASFGFAFGGEVSTVGVGATTDAGGAALAPAGGTMGRILDVPFPRPLP